jgi:hypothetical protein
VYINHTPTTAFFDVIDVLFDDLRRPGTKAKLIARAKSSMLLNTVVLTVFMILF